MGGAWRVAAAPECRYWPSGRCRGAGCSSACWMPASNSSSLSSAKPFDLPPPARDLLHHHDFRVPPRRSPPRGYRVRLSRDERVPPGLGGELVQLLHQIPLALVLPRQQPVLVKLAGARLTQNPLGNDAVRARPRRAARSRRGRRLVHLPTGERLHAERRLDRVRGRRGVRSVVAPQLVLDGRLYRPTGQLLAPGRPRRGSCRTSPRAPPPRPRGTSPTMGSASSRGTSDSYSCATIVRVSGNRPLARSY